MSRDATTAAVMPDPVPPRGRADPGLAAALAPVREALRAAGAADAERLRRQARQTEQQLLDQARDEVEEILAEARRRGAADAATADAAALARARRQARARSLRVRREVYEQLRARSRLAVSELAGDPELMAGLAAAARRTLGPQATLRPAEGGGVIAEAPGRRLDYSLAGFADRAVDEIAAELEAGP